MSRTIRLVVLVSTAMVSGACSESPTSPTVPATSVTKPAPQKPNADDVCDWINPWTRC